MGNSFHIFRELIQKIHLHFADHFHHYFPTVYLVPIAHNAASHQIQLHHLVKLAIAVRLQCRYSRQYLYINKIESARICGLE